MASASAFGAARGAAAAKTARREIKVNSWRYERLEYALTSCGVLYREGGNGLRIVDQNRGLEPLEAENGREQNWQLLTLKDFIF